MGKGPGYRRSGRKRRHFSGTGAWRNILLAVITLYVVWQGINYTRDIVMSRLLRVEEARYGVIEDVLPVEGTLIRNEKVLPAPKTGRLKILIPEGERVRVGAVVAQVAAPAMDSQKGETLFNITAPVTGIVSYQTDGLEGVYTPLNLQVLPVSRLRGTEIKPNKLTEGMQVEEGKPVAKIVNNLEPVNILGVIPKEKVPFDMLETGKRVKVRFEKDQAAPVYLSVADSSFQGKENLYRLVLNNYSDSFINPRTVSFELVTKRFEGFIVPADALVAKEDKLGVYIIYKEAVKWKNVQVIGQINDKVAVGGLEPGVSVVQNPQYAREGRPFRHP
ncbi:MAG: HlyD family efflux transporter periplasmic adaptor subunit [Bacillota bacterium]